MDNNPNPMTIEQQALAPMTEPHEPGDMVEREPFAWADGVSWHKPAHRSVMASVRLGAWMSAALDDPAVCDAMKADIREWFSAGEPMETLCAALAASGADRMREALEVIDGDLFMLRKAIEAGDPKAELLMRVDDAKKEARQALGEQQ